MQPELFNGKKWVGVSVKTANNSEDKISKNKKMIIQECQQKKSCVKDQLTDKCMNICVCTIPCLC